MRKYFASALIISLLVTSNIFSEEEAVKKKEEKKNRVAEVCWTTISIALLIATGGIVAYKIQKED